MKRAIESKDISEPEREALTEKTNALANALKPHILNTTTKIPITSK